MSSELRRSSHFSADVLRQFGWYVDKAGEDVAWRFEAAVEETLRAIAQQPELGRLRRFENPRLAQLRSIPVTRPFNKLIIFYRAEGDTVEAWRLMHGARDLPWRL